MYLDDLKLFARNKTNLESLVSTVNNFSGSVHMNFRIDKCATAPLITGKLSGCEGIAVTTDTIIPALNSIDSYKYLGAIENDRLKETLVKDLIVSSYKKEDQETFEVFFECP